jgi:hypothetical protein
MSDPMPMIQLNFDARTVQPSAPFEPLPTAWYNVKIVGAETKPTQKNNGDYYLELVEEVIDGSYAGRKVFDRLNLKNENPTAQEIAWRTLSAICHATGVLQVQTPQDLFGRPMQARVVLKPARTEGEKTYDAYNDVKGYKACDKQPGMSGPPASGPTGSPTPGGSPPWAGAPAPAPTAPAPAPAAPPQAAPPAPPPAQPRINPPQPYQENDVVIQPGQPSGYQLKGGQWVPYTPPPAPPPAPNGGWAPPQAAPPPPAPGYGAGVQPPPVTNGGQPWAQPPAGQPTQAPPSAPPAGAPGAPAAAPPWARG